MLKAYLFTWENLKTINKNQIVSSTYIWLVIVPFIAKLTSKLENTIAFTFSGKVYEIDLVLPFSWQLFFLSALAFVLGNIVYIIFCPKIIKDYRNASEFIATGKHQGELYIYMNDALKRMQDEHNKNVAKFIKMKEEHNAKWPHLDIKTQREDDIKQQFWMIYDYYSKTRAVFRRIAWFFYLIGFVTFFIVAITNIFWVIPQIDLYSIW